MCFRSSATEPDDTSQPMMVDAKMPALKLNSSTDQQPHPAANKPATSNVATQAKLNAMQHSGAASLSRAGQFHMFSIDLIQLEKNRNVKFFFLCCN